MKQKEEILHMISSAHCSHFLLVPAKKSLIWRHLMNTVGNCVSYMVKIYQQLMFLWTSVYFFQIFKEFEEYSKTIFKHCGVLYMTTNYKIYILTLTLHWYFYFHIQPRNRHITHNSTVVPPIDTSILTVLLLCNTIDYGCITHLTDDLLLTTAHYSNDELNMLMTDCCLFSDWLN